TGYVSPRVAWSTSRKIPGHAIPPEPPPLRKVADAVVDFDRTARVTVLVPTVDRYSYLRTLLEQLRQQTIAPLEIIVVDQTAVERRDQSMLQEFRDLPLNWIFQDAPGQCTSRNAGLKLAKGDYVLFIDDDDEVEPDLIESHLKTLACFKSEVSSGVAD